MSDMHGCLACGHEVRPWLRMPIDPVKNAPTPYGDTVRCDHCGLGRLASLPSAELIPSLYAVEDYYTHENGNYVLVPPNLLDRVMAKLAYWCDRQTPFSASAMAALLGDAPTACDVGCGNGVHLAALKSAGVEVIGIEPDDAARQEAERKDLHVLAGTAEQLPGDIAGRQFGLVMMTHALEHCLDPVAAVANIFSLVAPGGYFYVEVPNCQSEHFRTFSVCSLMFDAPRHLHFFDPGNLALMLSRAGFVPGRVTYQGYQRNFDPSWRRWEQMIYERAMAHDSTLPLRYHSQTQSLRLLLRTMLAADERKYDSFAILAQRPAA